MFQLRKRVDPRRFGFVEHRRPVAIALNPLVLPAAYCAIHYYDPRVQVLHQFENRVGRWDRMRGCLRRSDAFQNLLQRRAVPRFSKESAMKLARKPDTFVHDR